MSMPNFNTMRNFPLYVRDFISEVDYCPACNTYGEDGVCPICGAATERKAYLDEVAAFEFAERFCKAHRCDFYGRRCLNDS